MNMTSNMMSMTKSTRNIMLKKYMSSAVLIMVRINHQNHYGVT